MATSSPALRWITCSLSVYSWFTATITLSRSNDRLSRKEHRVIMHVSDDTYMHVTFDFLFVNSEHSKIVCMWVKITCTYTYTHYSKTVQSTTCTGIILYQCICKEVNLGYNDRTLSNSWAPVTGVGRLTAVSLTPLSSRLFAKNKSVIYITHTWNTRGIMFTPMTAYTPSSASHAMSLAR